MKRWMAAALSGCAATAPMTVAMLWLHRHLPRHERYALPPAQVTERVAEQAGLESDLDGSLSPTILLSHFGFGAGAGAFYGPISRWLPGPPVVRGMLFGLGVWASFYLGVLPALRILSPATEHPARRNALMIVAHLIWGASLALATRSLNDTG